jgi:hypothetical protein
MISKKIVQSPKKKSVIFSGTIQVGVKSSEISEKNFFHRLKKFQISGKRSVWSFPGGKFRDKFPEFPDIQKK